MNWGRNTLSAVYPGQQGAGGQALTSKPIYNITPPLLKEVAADEIEAMEENESGLTIPSDSENPDPENESENPDELTDEMKQEIIKKLSERETESKEGAVEGGQSKKNT